MFISAIKVSTARNLTVIRSCVSSCCCKENKPAKITRALRCFSRCLPPFNLFSELVPSVVFQIAVTIQGCIVISVFSSALYIHHCTTAFLVMPLFAVIPLSICFMRRCEYLLITNSRAVPAAPRRAPPQRLFVPSSSFCRSGF